MRAALSLLAIASLAAPVAPARAGTLDAPPKPPRTITIKVHRDTGRPIIVTLDGKPMPPIVLRKLAETPRPRCTRDHRGTTRCRITY